MNTTGKSHHLPGEELRIIATGLMGLTVVALGDGTCVTVMRDAIDTKQMVAVRMTGAELREFSKSLITATDECITCEMESQFP